MWKIYILTFVVILFVVYRWVKGIDYMTQNHPDYKGDDLFGEFNEDDKNNIL